jgi:hypothetical protein
MMTLAEAVQVARGELQWSTLEDIQGQTAMTWAGRAIAAYENYLRSGQNQALSDACEFHHEALEHGAGATSDVLESIRGPLQEAARAAGVNR